ncbi:MAG TPA: glycosyltransferase family 2 protein [Anaerolineales bacterium]|nr:glycosyltransferase family 2 protein [Anaerolineales bacterium]
MQSDKRFPLVSIITPSFNQCAYLEYTIQSVLSQDYPEIEYIVVDGGSTDGSHEIIEKYAAEFAWWVSEPDNGQGEAINKGIAHSSGEIVAWLNSDDLYLPGAVSRAVKAFQSKPEAGMVYGDAITIDAGGCPIKALRFPSWGLEQLAAFRIICQPAVFMRRNVLERAGFLDTSYHYMLDHRLWLRIAENSEVAHAPQIWAAARHHPTAKNVARPSEFGRETLRLLEWMQTEPDLSQVVERNRRQVRAGAYRLNGRYLLDGGMPAKALQAYGQALLAQPGYALKHWHRMLFAVFSLIGGEGLAEWYYRFRRARPPALDFEPGVTEWPGLCFSHQN